MEPVSLLLMTAVAGKALDSVLGEQANRLVAEIVGGVISNRSDWLVCTAARSSWDFFKNLRTQDPVLNHDLERATRESYLLATLELIRHAELRVELGSSRLLAAGDRVALAAIRRGAETDLRDVDNTLPRPLTDTQLFVIDPEIAPPERLARLRATLRQNLSEDFGRWLPGESVPSVVDQLLRDGWTISTANVLSVPRDWYSLIAIAFVEKLKTTPRLSVVFEARLLAEIASREPVAQPIATFQGLAECLETIMVPLQRIENAIAVGFSEVKHGLGEVKDGIGEVKDGLDDIRIDVGVIKDFAQGSAAKAQTAHAINSTDTIATNRDRSFLKHLRDYILNSSPPWDEHLYTPLAAIEAHRPDPSLWLPLLTPQGSTWRGHRQTLSDCVQALHTLERPLVITGPAGSGKSVVLRQFALTVIRRELEESKPERIPVLINLKAFERRFTNFRDFLHSYLGGDGTSTFTSWLSSSLTDYLQAGRLVLLLDGLDEMPGSDNSLRLGQIKRFTLDFPGNRFVFTCRSLVYDPAFQVRQFALQELDNKQIRDFIVKSLESEVRVPYPPPLEPSEMGKVSGLLDFCRNPLSLRMLVTYYQTHGHLPASTHVLYGHFCDYVLDRADLSPSTRDRFRKFLSTFAFTTMRLAGEGHDVTRRLLSENGNLPAHHRQIDLERAIKSGIVLEDSSTQALWFAHHRLQEFLAAEYLRRKYEPEVNPAALEFCYDDVWYHDVVTALVAASPNPVAIIDYLLRGHSTTRALLAVDCMEVSPGRVPQALIEMAVQSLDRFLQSDVTADRVRAVEAWSKLEVTNASQRIRRHLADPSPWVRETAISSLETLRIRGRVGFRIWSTVAMETNKWTSGIVRFLVFTSWTPYLLWGATGGLFLLLARGLRETSDFGVIGLGGLCTLALYEGVLVLLNEASYTSDIRARASASAWVASRNLVIGGCAGALLAYGVAIIRLIPLVMVGAGALVGILVARRGLLRSTDSAVDTVFVSARHLVPPLVIGMALFAGFRTDTSSIDMGLFVAAIFSIIGSGLIAMWASDGTAIRSLQKTGEREVGEVGKETVNRLIAIATVEHPSLLNLVKSRAQLIRRQALRALGHLPYDSNVMDVLVRTAQYDDSDLLRDSAAQAIDEIQHRQRRGGRIEGLEVQVRDHLSADAHDAIREPLAVWVLGAAAALSFALSSVVTVVTTVGLAQMFLSADLAKGFVYRQLNLDRQAISALERHVSQRPSDVGALNMLAWTYATTGSTSLKEPDRAIRFAQQAVELNGWREEAYIDTLVQAYVAAGRYAEALATVEKGLARSTGANFLKRRQAELKDKAPNANKR